LNRNVEPETVAIKRQRGGDILDDEKRRDAGNVWLHHRLLHDERLLVLELGPAPENLRQCHEDKCDKDEGPVDMKSARDGQTAARRQPAPHGN
jgi:hypothetical protein